MKREGIMSKKYSFYLSVALIIAVLAANMGFVAEKEVLVASAAEQERALEVGEVNVVPLHVTGPAEERLNLVIFGDGYTVDEMDKFRERMWTGIKTSSGVSNLSEATAMYFTCTWLKRPRKILV